MTRITLFFVLLATFGCTNVATKDKIRDQHAIYSVYIEKMEKGETNNNQDKQMIRSAGLTLQALDREINGWKPTANMNIIEVNKQ
jgi:hypothetical protein